MWHYKNLFMDPHPTPCYTDSHFQQHLFCLYLVCAYMPRVYNEEENIPAISLSLS